MSKKINNIPYVIRAYSNTKNVDTNVVVLFHIIRLFTQNKLSMN